MNDILHLVTVYEVLIYCQTIQGGGGYRLIRDCVFPSYLTIESGRIDVVEKLSYLQDLWQLLTRYDCYFLKLKIYLLHNPLWRLHILVCVINLEPKKICFYSNLSEVDLSAFIYRLFREDFSSVWTSAVHSDDGGEIFMKQSVNKCI